MSIITHFIPMQVIHALGWTLIHSIWQIALIVLFIALIRFFIPKSTSKTQYGMAMAGMVLIAFTAIITFLTIYTTDYKLSATSFDTLVPVEKAADISLENLAGVRQDTGSVSNMTLTLYIDRYVPVIVSVYILILLTLSMKLIIGLYNNQRLTRNQTFPVPENWQEKLTLLCEQLQIRKMVLFMESKLVKVPLVIGYFKPVILMPAGILTGLPADQVEVLILHELGHISRNDYLLNLFQSFMEILFFYHPAVWWLSSIIRTEREQCCDDYVMDHRPNVLAYSKALINSYARLLGNNKLAMAASGNKMEVFSRIKRISGQSTVKPSLLEHLFSFILLALSIFAIMYACEELSKKQQDSSINLTIIGNEIRVDGEKVVMVDQLKKDETYIRPLGVYLTKLKQKRDGSNEPIQVNLTENIPYSLYFSILYTCSKNDFYKISLNMNGISDSLILPNSKVYDQNNVKAEEVENATGNKLNLALAIKKDGFILYGNYKNIFKDGSPVIIPANEGYDFQTLVNKLIEIKEQVRGDQTYLDTDNISITAEKDIEMSVIFNTSKRIRYYQDSDGVRKSLFPNKSYGMVL